MKSRKVIIFILSIILILDFGTKYLAYTFLRQIRTITIIPDFLHLTYVENRGAAFGFLAEANSRFRTPFFILVSLLAIIFIISLYKKIEGNRIFHTGLLFILGGAVGNLIDRLRSGFVIDFLDFHWYQYHWPAFNLADTFICIGVGLLLFDMFFCSKENKVNCTPYSLK
jgi:signal peptidase II